MDDEPFEITDPRMQAAVEEIRTLILAHFPTTTFEVGEAEEADSVYMRAIVDVDDTDDVIAVFLDRLVDVQVDENLALYVVPVRTPERRAAAWEREQSTWSLPALPV